MKGVSGARRGPREDLVNTGLFSAQANKKITIGALHILSVIS
jgi:hypothetical protein